MPSDDRISCSRALSDSLSVAESPFAISRLADRAHIFDASVGAAPSSPFLTEDFSDSIASRRSFDADDDAAPVLPSIIFCCSRTSSSSFSSSGETEEYRDATF